MTDFGIDSSPIKRVVQVDSAGTPFYAGASAVNSQKNEDAAHSSGDTGTFVLAVRNDAAAARTNADTDYTPFSVDSTGAVQTNASVFTYKNIAAGQATTVVKASAGYLHSITLNSAATATNTTVVYDNASGSGTVIARPAATTATVPTTLTYDVYCPLGITIITATANGSDMTVSYR